MKLLENTFQPNPNFFPFYIIHFTISRWKLRLFLGGKISHSNLFQLLSVANYKNKMMYFFFWSKTKETEPGSSEKFRLLYVMVTPYNWIHKLKFTSFLQVLKGLILKEGRKHRSELKIYSCGRLDSNNIFLYIFIENDEHRIECIMTVYTLFMMKDFSLGSCKTETFQTKTMNWVVRFIIL